MSRSSEVKLLVHVGIVAAFATLAFVGTTIIRIPIPATGGYFNLGDTFVMTAAVLYGPIVGLVVGAIGPALADAVGFPQFILATAVVKGLEGLVVGALAFSDRKKAVRVVLGLAAGVFILVSGYYIFEAAIYPFIARWIPFFGVTDAKAALAEIIPNLLQGLISAVVAFGIWKVFNRRQLP